MRTLREGGCLLEPQLATHAAEMFAVLRDPALYELEGSPPASAAWLERRFAKLEARASPDGREQWLNWVVRLRAGEVAGYVQATIARDGVAKIAYVLGSKHWRQGIGSAAVEAMLRELAAAYGVRLAIAMLKTKNLRSRGLLHKLRFGYAPPASVPRFGHEADELVMYKLLGAAENRPMLTVLRVTLEPPSMRHAAPFIEAALRSRSLHRGWATPPVTREQFQAFVRRSRADDFAAHLLLTGDGELAGVINLSEIVKGAFCSAYLGYYAFVPHAGRGYIRAGLEAVLLRAFRDYGLHRVEANIRPENVRSKALVQGLGFACEGYSPRYLKIAGRWRDHERWALTVEDWNARRKRRAAKRYPSP